METGKSKQGKCSPPSEFTRAKIEIPRDDGLKDDLSISFFFREPPDFPPLERAALDLCRGYVLDVGAGAGCHSLALQNRGLSVCAIDIAPEAVEIMQKRGIIDARCVDIFDFKEEPFDTILILNHGIGLVENLLGLNRFLKDAHRMLKLDAKKLIAYNRLSGRYFGEVRLQFEYKKRKGAPFGWLYVDPLTLTNHASKAGWTCEIISQIERKRLSKN